MVKVDCCEKALDYRPMIMFWEKCDLGWQWCPVPEESSTSDIDFFWMYGGWNIISFWMSAPSSQQFSCPPYTWTLVGQGELIPSESELGAFAEYRIRTIDYQALDCNEDITIEVEDRCGERDYVHFKPCCSGDLEPVELGYTTLAMSCSGSQTFGATGGCGPYSWSASSGTITSEGVYTAPATNAECANNDTVTVTDCCGGSDSVQIAVNCYVPLTTALAECDQIKCWCYKLQNPDCGGVTYESQYRIHAMNWRCDGVQTLDWWWQGLQNCTASGRPPCVNNCPCDAVDEPGCWNCDANCNVLTGFTPCNTLLDMRTAAMKTGGCCPLNPFTGLPY